MFFSVFRWGFIAGSAAPENAPHSRRMISRKRAAHNQTIRGVLLAATLLRFDGAAAVDKSLAARFDGTRFEGTLHSEGCIFEIRAKRGPVAVRRLDVNIDAGTDTIEVRARPGVAGRVVDTTDLGWVRVAAFPGVVGRGKNRVTSLPAFAAPVTIPAGAKHAFHVTTTAGHDPVDMWYSHGSAEGRAYASDDDVDLLEGRVVGSFNGHVGTASPRQWNGIVHYSVAGGGPTASPSTSLPTPSPMSNQPPTPSLSADCQYVSCHRSVCFIFLPHCADLLISFSIVMTVRKFPSQRRIRCCCRRHSSYRRLPPIPRRGRR